MPLHLACIVGARPNFMKMAPIIRAIESGVYAGQAKCTLIHTGQHYDANLSDVFFAELGMRKPDISLEVGSGSHAVQTARIMERIEPILVAGPKGGSKFDWLVVVGDVNSTMATAIAAAKLEIPIAHVEAGLRSFDRSMPEEINRIVTDSITDLLLVSEPAGAENLRREGHPDNHVVLVGNVMIDTLLAMLDQAKKLEIPKSYGLSPSEYGVVTLHRPSNVDDPETLAQFVKVLSKISTNLPLVFPVHPRTRQVLEKSGLLSELERNKGVHLAPPLGYLPFLSLTSQAKVIVTDSGGLQEESTALGIPCLTMRDNTERPITVEMGTSTLIGSDPEKLEHSLLQVLNGTYKIGHCPELWDGHASERIALALLAGYSI
jgi:UDP-N-acetylglucosamine 2-epimerase (non-hydrolysing)